MTKVHLLGRQTKNATWGFGPFIVIAAYATRKEAKKVADQKNLRSLYFFHSVQTKTVKESA